MRKKKRTEAPVDNGEPESKKRKLNEISNAVVEESNTTNSGNDQKRKSSLSA